MKKNIFVIGHDEENARVLERLPDAERYAFHGLLTPEELQHGEIDIVALVGKAQKQLDAFKGEIDAIVGYWDSRPRRWCRCSPNGMVCRTSRWKPSSSASTSIGAG